MSKMIELNNSELKLVSGGIDMTGWSQADIDEYYRIQAEKNNTPFNGGGSGVSGVEGERSSASRIR